MVSVSEMDGGSIMEMALVTLAITIALFGWGIIARIGWRVVRLMI